MAILVVIGLALLARLAGWVDADQILAARPGTDFIYHPDRWSFVVALLAAVAGVVSLTSGRMTGIAGVFISVTTVPAAANVALGVAFWLPQEVLGSAAQLGINLVAMVLAGWGTLVVRRHLGRRLPISPLQRDLINRRRRDQLRKP